MASETVTYDAAVIMDSADRLYRQAKSIVISSTALGVLIGVVGGPVGVILATESRGSLGIAAAVGAAVGGLMGYIRGTERAFSLKLQAQVALCQVQIERNTFTANGG